ncbi:MAG: UDP-N-acetylmuramoyl-tripeptide--D-alanyl-D-alanine ligase, partial [Candidatus Marinamargulisbacteria bacterium]
MKVCIDSRTVQAGDVFIPVKGPHFDGHDFIEEAAQKGARILDVDLYSYAKKYRKKLPSAVIAVTGSAGKTTVKDMLYAVLSEKYQVVKTEENQN